MSRGKWGAGRGERKSKLSISAPNDPRQLHADSPALHAEHALWPTASWYWPAAQALHETVPAAAANLPVAHSAQVAMPFELENLPEQSHTRRHIHTKMKSNQSTSIGLTARHCSNRYRAAVVQLLMLTCSAESAAGRIDLAE